MQRIDAIVIGRNTFELVLTFKTWPYAKPVFVLSRTIKSVPVRLNGKAEILSGKPDKIVNELIARGYNILFIDGGKTIQGFLKLDLIDEIILTKIPIILGEGIPLFGKLIKELKFKHIKTKVFNNALVRSRYKRIIG